MQSLEKDCNDYAYEEIIRDMKTVAIIQARCGSSRLPGKVLKDLCGKPVLAHDLERISQAKKIDQVIVATTENQGDDQVASLADSLGFVVFRGSENDVLARYYGAAKESQADIILRITSDCPLIDALIIDEMIEEFEDHMYDISYNVPLEGEELTYPRGLDVEIFRFTALKDAYENAVDPYEREHVTPYIYENYSKRHYHRWNQSFPAYRWTLDTEEDFLFISEVYRYLYKGIHNFYTDDILELLRTHPELNEINAQVKQKERGEE